MQRIVDYDVGVRATEAERVDGGSAQALARPEDARSWDLKSMPN